MQDLAVCFGTTELDQFEWIGQGYQAATVDRSLTQSSSVRNSWQRLVLSPTYAVYATDALAVGVSYWIQNRAHAGLSRPRRTGSSPARTAPTSG